MINSLNLEIETRDWRLSTCVGRISNATRRRSAEKVGAILKGFRDNSSFHVLRSSDRSLYQYRLATLELSGGIETFQNIKMLLKQSQLCVVPHLFAVREPVSCSNLRVHLPSRSDGRSRLRLTQKRCKARDLRIDSSRHSLLLGVSGCGCRAWMQLV